MNPVYFETRFRIDHLPPEWPAKFAIITAHAPTGQTWTDAENETADISLFHVLERSGGWTWRITGYSPASGHAEAGWAVDWNEKTHREEDADWDWEFACDLGQAFKQDAIYWVQGDQLHVTHCDARRQMIPVGNFRERLDVNPTPPSGPAPPSGYADPPGPIVVDLRPKRTRANPRPNSPPNRWRMMLLACLTAVWGAVAAAQAPEQTPSQTPDRVTQQPPNVILILADDLGWADAGCYGNTFNETPRIDRLASEGMRFTQFYAGPVCSPTRANLQTGLDQARFGITQHIPGHRRPFAKLIDPVVPRQLPLDADTFARQLAARGYATGYFGKWHLGGPGFGPAERGWQTVREFQGNTVPPRITGADGPRRTTEFLSELAVDFLESNRDRPFLLQLSHFAVHIPLSTTDDRLAKYRDKPPMEGYPSLPEYAGLLEELDESVGAVVDTVDRLGLAERTLILFVSDNGGLVHQQNGEVVTSNHPLRGEKGQLYEGGIRVPAIARWPGTIPPGTVCDTPATTIDLAATFIDVANNASDNPAATVFETDGTSLLPVLRNPAANLPRDTLYWHLPHYHHSTPAGAIRRGDWKLIEFFEDESLELYDLANDQGETHNLASKENTLAESLRSDLAAWRKRINARMPIPNPNHDPARETELQTNRPADR